MKRGMRRLLVPGFIAAVLLAPAAIPVSAHGPTREAAPAPALIVDTSCGFTVNVTFPVNDEYALTFRDADGAVTRVIITGHFVATFTNATSGVSYTANISGPSHADFVRGTSSQEGRTGGPVGSLPGLNVFAGRVDLANGALHGHLVADICALLAPGV